MSPVSFNNMKTNGMIRIAAIVMRNYSNQVEISEQFSVKQI